MDMPATFRTMIEAFGASDIDAMRPLLAEHLVERSAWRARSTEGAEPRFSRDALADDVPTLLPGGLVIEDRNTVIESMSGPP